MSQPIELRPSPKYQVQLWAIIACVFAFLIFPFIFLGFAPGLGLLYVVLFLLANILWLVPAIVLVPVYYRSIAYRLTDRDLIVRRGILIRAEDVVPYAMITNIAVRRGPIERLLGLATLHVHTAGYSQQAGAEAKVVGMEDWERVHAALLQRIHEHQARQRPVSPEGAVVVAAESEGSVPALLQQILAELRQLRAILARRDN